MNTGIKPSKPLFYLTVSVAPALLIFFIFFRAMRDSVISSLVPFEIPRMRG